MRKFVFIIIIEMIPLFLFAELFDGINAVEIDIADLPGGFYLVKIPQMKGQYATKRFVKVRK